MADYYHSLAALLFLCVYIIFTSDKIILNQQRIYFLGEPFSFHYLAAQAFFGGDNQFVSAASFDAIIEQTRLNENSFGVMAVENTLAGDVPGNFIRIANSGLTICGSITLPVELFLAAKENISLDQLTTVYSHEMAIKETSTFFSQYPHIQFTATPSTSGAVKLVAEHNNKNIAAIGNKAAILFYHLQIIASKIDNHASNFTRFLILSKKSLAPLTTFPAKIASLILQPYEMEDFTAQFGADAIHLIRHTDAQNVYIETKELLPEQIINIALKYGYNTADSRVLGIYNHRLTEEL